MQNNCVHTKSVASITLDDAKPFWKAVKLSVVKPHTINRILSGSEFAKIYRCVDTTSNGDGQLIDRITSLLINNDRSDGSIILIEQAFEKFHIPFVVIEADDFLKKDLEQNSSIFVILSKYFPRNLKLHHNSLELVLLGRFGLCTHLQWLISKMADFIIFLYVSRHYTKRGCFLEF